MTSDLASYRGYDTCGETTVVLAAAVGAIILLGASAVRTRSRGREGDEETSNGPKPGGAA